ncbi:MAG: TIGR04372 family glycosyltransferase [Sulfuritalea sp.]|nr:TIGR04372 family glycosyltransferase [Sulfuritalea sp.]
MSLNEIQIRLTTYLIVARQRYRERGALWAVSGIARKFGEELLWLILLPGALLGHVLGYRCLNVRTEHIGHLATEPDTLLKEVRLGRIAARRRILLAPPHRVSNQHLLNYWRPYFTVIDTPWFCLLLQTMSRHLVMKQDVSRYVSKFFGTQDIYPINALWGDRPPIVSLTGEDEVWGQEILGALGVPPGRWFVAVHVREGGFLPRNEIIQSHRNASIGNTFLAMQEIVRRGGLCIRMGDSSMTPMPAMPGVIDYALHPLKSDRMDVFLCAKARFFLGCTSGLAFLSSTFGVPVAQANMIPIETLGIRYCDLSIPKLLWSRRLDRYLGFKEVLDSELGGYFFTQQYVDAEIDVHENSSEDILSLVVEMLELLNPKFVETDEGRALHQRYISLFRFGHYSYGAASHVSIEFLRKHQLLLERSDL